jgi:hypothetical protein
VKRLAMCGVLKLSLSSAWAIEAHPTPDTLTESRETQSTPGEVATPGQPAVGGMNISEPAPGTSVTPGQALTVTLDPLEGWIPERVLIYTNTGHSVLLNSSPWTTTLYVPQDAIGDITLYASAIRGKIEHQAGEVVLQVDLSGAPLLSISATPATAYILPWSMTSSITVMGHYDDGVDRQLTNQPGTTFATTDDTIATVDSNGVITGFILGETRVDVTYGSHATRVTVIVAGTRHRLTVNDQQLDWHAMADTIGYDVVKGNLSLLRTSGGDFEVAIEACLANDLDETTLVLPPNLNPGEGSFFLVRAVTGADSYTYDTTDDWLDSSQVESRDLEIDAAAHTCP